MRNELIDALNANNLVAACEIIYKTKFDDDDRRSISFPDFLTIMTSRQTGIQTKANGAMK